MSTTPKKQEIPRAYLKMSPFESVSSFLMSLLGALFIIAAFLVASWISIQKPKPREPILVELFEDPGGSEDGAPDETLRIDAPGPEVADATTAAADADDRNVEQAMDSVVEMASESASANATQSEPQFEVGTPIAGKPGKVTGTGRRPLGRGNGKGGFPREDRWYVRFGSLSGVDEYAKQLDYFGIELGVVLDGKLIYISKLATARPVSRTVAGGKDEGRLYFTWQGGNRKQADVQLFRKAGIDVGNAPLLHFYPKPTEDALAQLEFKYRNRRAAEIRRTFFEVIPSKAGYDFEVVRQTYLK